MGKIFVIIASTKNNAVIQYVSGVFDGEIKWTEKQEDALEFMSFEASLQYASDISKWTDELEIVEKEESSIELALRKPKLLVDSKSQRH